MRIDRRGFIGTAGTALLFAGRLEGKAIQNLGVQLYTVRTELEKDFERTIERVAAIGYKEVEFAGYYKRTPEEVRDVLKKNGLTAPSAHTEYASLAPDKLPAVLDGAHTMGHQFLVNPWVDESMRKDLDGWKKVAETFNRAGEQCQKAGIQFAYHNHHFEFVPMDGQVPYDTLLESCDSKLVKMELDLAWITVAGRDPLDYFHRYPGRFPLVHVKGFKGRPSKGVAVPFEKAMPDLTDVGKAGDIINWSRIFAKSDEAGIKHYFVEHDVPKAPFESLENSYRYLAALHF